MEIEYCTQYQQLRPKIIASESGSLEGLSESRITEIETAVNNGDAFPKALREFLYIGGLWNNIGVGGPVNGWWDKFQGYKKQLVSRGNLPSRPIFIFSSFEEVVASFIYLDEGDDPRPWNIALSDSGIDYEVTYDDEGNEISFTTNEIWRMGDYLTFSEMINTKADLASRGLPTA